jgi:hypothetical protein
MFGVFQQVNENYPITISTKIIFLPEADISFHDAKNKYY